MKLSFLLAGLVLLTASCQSPTGKKSFETRLYYPLDSLLATQKKHLVGKKILKKVIIGNEEETASLTVTPAFLDKEWGFLDEFDLNKPGFVGAIEIIQSDSILRYEPNEEESLVLSFLEYSYNSSGNLAKISGAYFDSNAEAIYGSYRDFEFIINEEWISSYTIRGYQKIIMKDTAFFEVTAFFQE